MKKALALLFTFVVAGALALPVFAQDAPASPDTSSAPKKKAKHHKKAKKGDAGTAAPAPAPQL